MVELNINDSEHWKFNNSKLKPLVEPWLENSAIVQNCRNSSQVGYCKGNKKYLLFNHIWYNWMLELTPIEALVSFSHLHSLNVESTLLGLTIGSMLSHLLWAQVRPFLIFTFTFYECRINPSWSYHRLNTNWFTVNSGKACFTNERWEQVSNTQTW